MIDQIHGVAPRTALDPSALDLLRLTLPGRVLTPDDAEYDAARNGFGAADLPSPDLVIMAAHAEHVVAAVRFAREQGLPVSVKATGHNFGFAYQGGLMINTEQMQGISINPQARTARVEAGVRWGAVVSAAHKHGLAPLNGSAPHVGVVGYSLFGGFGWLLRKYGAAVDSVLAAEIVTADGELRHINADQEPDLFWALRGASGNFGVVTALEFKLYPVSDIYGGALFFPLERTHEVMNAYSRWTATAPEEITSSIVMFRLPPVPDLPPMLRGKAIITIRAAYVGNEAEGAALLQPLRDLGGAILDTFAMMPYTQARTINNDPEKGMPVRRSTLMLKDLSPATINTLLRVNGTEGSNPVMIVEIRHLGGAMTRVAPHSTAFSQRYAPFIMQTVHPLMGPEGAIIAEQNTRAVQAAMQAHATGGVFPSWLGDGDYGVHRMRAGFTAEHYARLVELKTQYDPTNMFRLNHNIPPATPQ